ncbi:helix-turn-helix domain-containing protein [Collinsella aerofaciens]|uniref:helix-turn-helix domain-containing protein n=1 Tax=Collinsella aerofaciens TaxID=74426 RepID=UPI0022DFD734|nr:helix-turn-helix domain-containing protein [Collinsella aerofaciens]
MEFGDKLRSLRTKAGLTQLDIAEKLDVSAAAIGAWENGRAKPRLTKLGQLAELFDTTVADLMGEDASEAAISGASHMVPLLGFAHMGEPCDEGSLADEVEVPASIADAHPRGFMVHAQGGCMDNRFPHDALLLVDPDMEPVNGQPVLAETADYGAVVRNYTRGRSTVMLTADSHSGEYDDILAGPGDEPVVCKGRVVWYMGERDERG